MKLQKRLAAVLLKCSPTRVKFDTEKLSEIKEAITKADVKTLIGKGTIVRIPIKGASRVRSRKLAAQKRKGRRRGHGSRKGKFNARADEKSLWMNNVRAQREVLKRMRDKEVITTRAYRNIYAKVKGGFFRSIRHMKIFMEEKELFQNGKK